MIINRKLSDVILSEARKKEGEDKSSYLHGAVSLADYGEALIDSIKADTFKP